MQLQCGAWFRAVQTQKTNLGNLDHVTVHVTFATSPTHAYTYIDQQHLSIATTPLYCLT